MITVEHTERMDHMDKLVNCIAQERKFTVLDPAKVLHCTLRWQRDSVVEWMFAVSCDVRWDCESRGAGGKGWAGWGIISLHFYFFFAFFKVGDDLSPKLKDETLALAVRNFDRALAEMEVNKRNLQLLAVVCLLIAGKVRVRYSLA
jgi:hypothetical protein